MWKKKQQKHCSFYVQYVPNRISWNYRTKNTNFCYFFLKEQPLVLRLYHELFSPWNFFQNSTNAKVFVKNFAFEFELKKTFDE